MNAGYRIVHKTNTWTIKQQVSYNVDIFYGKVYTIISFIFMLLVFIYYFNVYTIIYGTSVHITKYWFTWE